MIVESQLGTLAMHSSTIINRRLLHFGLKSLVELTLNYLTARCGLMRPDDFNLQTAGGSGRRVGAAGLSAYLAVGCVDCRHDFRRLMLIKVFLLTFLAAWLFFL